MYYALKVYGGDAFGTNFRLQSLTKLLVGRILQQVTTNKELQMNELAVYDIVRYNSMLYRIEIKELDGMYVIIPKNVADRLENNLEDNPEDYDRLQITVHEDELTFVNRP